MAITCWQTASATYGNNRSVSHYSGHEKYLLGWIDTIVEVNYMQQPSICGLKPITQGEIMVLHAAAPSAIHSDWPLFKGTGPTGPKDQYLVFENRGSDVSSKFEYNPAKCGVYGYWVDTTRAGNTWPYTMDNTNYNNVYRQMYFDSMTSSPVQGGSDTRNGTQNSYLSPYTGLIGQFQVREIITSPVTGELLPSIVCLNNPLLDENSIAQIKVYPEFTPQVHLEELRKSPIFSQQYGGDAYELSVLFWDSEFSHSWPDGGEEPPYVPSFRVTYDKLLSWDGSVDPAFQPIVSDDIYEQFDVIASVQDLLNGGLFGEHFFRATIENLNPRTAGRTPDAVPFSLVLIDPITIPGEEPVVLSFDDEDIQSLFSSVGSGPRGGRWTYLADEAQSPSFQVAYCGRTDAGGLPIGYEPGLDVTLESDIKFKFVGTGTKTVTISMRHQIEKAIPADNETGDNPNWDLVGRPWDDDKFQVNGDHLIVEIRRFTDTENGEYEWFPVEYDGDEPSGEAAAYCPYVLKLTEDVLSKEGLDVINPDHSFSKFAQLRLRFVADDSVQFEGVFIKQIVLDE